MGKDGDIPGKPSRVWKARIKTKLFFGFAVSIATALGVVFSCLMALDYLRTTRDLEKVEQTLRANIINKGKQLAFNSSLAMRSLAEENSITTIREIVSSTVDGDSDIVYGIFMDPESKPWVIWERKEKLADIRGSLLDSTSRWAATISAPGYRSRVEGGIEVIEFAAPVRKWEEQFGVIRFGLTTESMHKAILRAKLLSQETRNQTLFLFLLAAVFTFIVASVVATVVAAKITQPITDLKTFATRMAGGDYELPVKIEGSDEISILAESFEAMRLKINDYMQNLQRLVDAKVHQVRDILDNIEQGLFTFNLDLKINEDSSKNAALILGFNQITGLTLADILRLSPKDEALFRDWVVLVSQEHAYQRWNKLSKLAPIHEIQIESPGGTRQIVLEYQRILDRKGRLSSVMALATDVTESRKAELRLRQEKTQHEKTVKTFMNLSRHTPETIVDFLKDAGEKLRGMRKKISEIGKASPSDQQAWVTQIFRDCHTIKGNAGAFGFEALAMAAENLENLLQASASSPDMELMNQIPEAKKIVETMVRENSDIDEVFHILTGNSKDASIRIAESKVRAIREMAEAVSGQTLNQELTSLVEFSRRLSNQSFFSSTTKYRELVKRAALKAGKMAELVISPPDLEVDPKILAKFDEALVHLLRNAVAHGIKGEAPEKEGEKAKGKIIFSCSIGEDGSYTFSIQDDGPGIDVGTLVEKAIEAGIVAPEAIAGMADQEKLGLIFAPGLSASSQSDSLSGRGLGMSIAADCVHLAGGKISLESRPGWGTRFVIITHA